MSKFDLINELQLILNDLNNVSSELSGNISNLKEILNEKDFVPDELSQNINDNLETVKIKQTEFLTKYKKINNAVSKKNYSLLENELNVVKESLDKKKKYLDAIDFFFTVDSDDEKVQKLLEERKAFLNSLNLDELQDNELKDIGEQYILFCDAYHETDVKKKFSLIYKMSAYFEEDIALNLQFGNLTINENKDQSLFDQNQKQDSTINNDTTIEEDDSDVEQEMDNELNEENLEKIFENVDTDSILIKEDQTSIKRYKSNKSSSNFSSKKFKNDMFDIEPYKLISLIESAKGFGYCPEVFDSKDISKYKGGAEKTLKLGYINKYEFGNYGYFYKLSERGEKAFKTKESVSFIKGSFKNTINLPSINHYNLDSANAVKMRVLFYDTDFKQKKLSEEELFSNEHASISEHFFLKECSGDELKFKLRYLGVITDDLLDLKNFKESVEIENEENDFLIVCGLTKEQSEAIAAWILNDFDLKSDSKNVYCTVIGNDNIYSFETGEPLKIDDVTSVMKSENNDDVSKDEQDSFNIENSTEDSLVSKVTDSLLTELKCEESEINDNHEEENSKDDNINSNQIEVQEKQISEEKISEEKKIVKKSISKQEIDNHLNTYQQMIISGHTYAATAYLKVLSEQQDEFKPYYRQLAYAVNDPLANCEYNSDSIINEFYSENLQISDYYAVSATLRNYFLDQFNFDYSIKKLNSLVQENELVKSSNDLRDILNVLVNFKYNTNKGIDLYADYRESERREAVQKLIQVKNQATEQLEILSTKISENKSNKRYIETRKMILSPTSELYELLTLVKEDEASTVEFIQEYLSAKYIKDQSFVKVENIDPVKINLVIDEYWDKASEKMREIQKSRNLVSSLRTNLFKRIYKVVSILCEYVSLKQSLVDNEESQILREYSKAKSIILPKIKNVLAMLDINDDPSEKVKAGKLVLTQALKEINSRLNGDYKDGTNRYFYIDFLKNDKVLLDDTYLPILEDVPDLENMSIIRRIELHCKECNMSFLDRLNNIFEGQDDYGSAKLILDYFSFIKYDLSEEDIQRFDVTKGINCSTEYFSNKRIEFIGDVELAQSYGQIDNMLENSKESILQIMDSWYKWATESKNYGFFYKILEEFKKKIKQDAQIRAIDLKNSLKTYQDDNPNWFNNEQKNKAVNEIMSRIEKQNYAAAEDLLNRLLANDIDFDSTMQNDGYFEEFLDEYDINYKKTADSGATLSSLITRNRNKDSKGGNKLLENWPRGAVSTKEDTIQKLLMALGFNVGFVTNEKQIEGKILNFSVSLKKPENGRKSNYKHPIYAFGSLAEENGFRIAVIFGKTDASRLIDTFKSIGNAKHTIIILDYALTLAERRILARKAKTDMTGKVFAVIDRVVIYYLSRHYSETAINRMLMSIIMPFAYFQPYIEKSADVMPPEIFIGRKYELDKIESPTGVNIVYGGRQLGKSALLRMAQKDIDNNENGDRAILVDVKGCDYKMAAKRISEELYDKNILKYEHITEDWDELARDIKKRLSDDNDKIPYLLLLIDEADSFIESCEAIEYQPFDALKGIQSIGTGRFKFVIAGLRNIVRFKRDAALKNNRSITHLESLTVMPFKATEARELLELPLSYLGFRFPKDSDTDALISTIFGTTNYFPGLLQLYCSKLIEAMQHNYAGYMEMDTPPYYVEKNHIKKVLAEQTLTKEIREKFFITLKVDDDDYYYIIALLIAYYIQLNKSQNGCNAEDLLDLADACSISKITSLTEQQLYALMEEMRELNVLQNIGDGRYKFARYSFCQMMGTSEQLENEIYKYME